MRCEQKVPYASELLATNAAWLHRAAYPDCRGVDVFRCKGCGEFHIGHPTPAMGADCAASKQKPPLWRPARWSRGHRHPSRRKAASR